MVKSESVFRIAFAPCNHMQRNKHVLLADAVKDICGHRDNLQCYFITHPSEYTELFRRITIHIKTFSSNHPYFSYINRVFGRFLSEHLAIEGKPESHAILH